MINPSEKFTKESTSKNEKQCTSDEFKIESHLTNILKVLKIIINLFLVYPIRFNGIIISIKELYK